MVGDADTTSNEPARLWLSVTKYANDGLELLSRDVRTIFQRSEDPAGGGGRWWLSRSRLVVFHIELWKIHTDIAVSVILCTVEQYSERNWTRTTGTDILSSLFLISTRNYKCVYFKVNG